MPVLLIIWRLAKPLLPYIAVALVVLGLLSAYGHREYGRGRTSRDGEVAAIKRDRDTALSNARVLQGALDTQSAAVSALKADGDKRVLDGKAALVAAQRANEGLSEQAAALRKSAGRKVDDTPCPISDTLAKVGAI